MNMKNKKIESKEQFENWNGERTAEWRPFLVDRMGTVPFDPFMSAPGMGVISRVGVPSHEGRSSG